MSGVDWSGVRERVAGLAADPGAKRVFGELEAQIGVRLPGAYRSFLLAVSRGGAGPFYGLFPLRRVDGRWSWASSGGCCTDLDRLADAFPHVAADTPKVPSDPGPVEADFATSAEFAAACRDWARRSDELYESETVGALYLSHHGCGYHDLLVLSGPERGAMWSDLRAADMGLNPIGGASGERVDFARWYLGWLNGATTPARSN